MMDIRRIIKMLPPMLSGDELTQGLTVMPDYDESIRSEDAPTRLIALMDLQKIYLPSDMSREIYSKFYLALIRSLQKKCTTMAVRQQNANFRTIMREDYNGIIGGSDSFTILGTSGIGKSSAISRAVSLITENRVIEMENPYVRIIPCVIVQCPFDSSAKGLMLEILRKVDELLDTKYCENAMRARATTDMLIGSVSQVCINHVGLLVVDEIQNVCRSKNGGALVGMLTQLINSSGISICMVGTPESAVFFQRAMQLARRSLGLQYSRLSYGEFFHYFCKTLFDLQYVKQNTEITEGIIEWLYEHSGGIISIVVSLIYDAQEIAILSGEEILNLSTLNQAYEKRLSMLHEYLQDDMPNLPRTSNGIQEQMEVYEGAVGQKVGEDTVSIADILEMSRKTGKNYIELLKESIPIMEVAV